MTAITVQDGKIVLRDGKVGTEQACCCGGCNCTCDDYEITVEIEGQTLSISPGDEQQTVILCEECDELSDPDNDPYHCKNWDNNSGYPIFGARDYNFRFANISYNKLRVGGVLVDGVERDTNDCLFLYVVVGLASGNGYGLGEYTIFCERTYKYRMPSCENGCPSGEAILVETIDPVIEDELGPIESGCHDANETNLLTLGWSCFEYPGPPTSVTITSQTCCEFP